MATEIESKAQATPKVQRDRSPAYPFISLKTAMVRMVALEAKFGRHPPPLDKVGLAWGYKGDSSQASQTLSALKYFGLVEYAGPPDHRVVGLTDDARNYMRAQQESTKAEILKSCALRPKAMRTYWEKWGAVRPINEVCLDQMIIKDNFTESAAKVFLRVYDETIDFAGLGNDDKLADEVKDGAKGSHPLSSPISPQAQTSAPPGVGDLVSWESGGVIQFESRRVVGLSPDGAFVFIEGSSAGIPAKETIVVTQAPPLNPQTQPPAAPRAFASPTAGASNMKQDTFTLDEGPVILQWPATMSATSYEDFKDWIDLQLRKIKRSITQ